MKLTHKLEMDIKVTGDVQDLLDGFEDFREAVIDNDIPRTAEIYASYIKEDESYQCSEPPKIRIVVDW